jgi:hypothetical protein
MVNNIQDTSYIKDQSQRGHNEDKLASEDDTITIYHQNIRGLRNRRAELLKLIIPGTSPNIMYNRTPPKRN